MAQEQDPLWYKDAIIYELHVKAFFDGNGDGMGDFPGLIAKLDYLQELGVNTLWLLPFYPSPGRDDGYDISDYHTIHPGFGEMADFRRFIDEAHRRGLRVITELVVNHTSDQHPWFQAARHAPPGSVKRDYYVWSDTDTKFSGTRVIFSDTEKSNWAWDEVAQAFYWHRFFSHQPDLNYANPHVSKAVMHAMRFWFDAGVDGMRLDAVPYLCEREGTLNENLPETHAVIKQMRAELDRHYQNRVFLAEANQWPEDVYAYFGEGDECHMAYHFPLMPRMYMAIAQEDRHPIVEIMEQTPDIPDTCQWAIFLRNHDELTLEMVTDRERDYLYQAYASDPQARLNLGIRRRLAPLLDNDRQRIELMYLLLMTMPGSPILYYGDEIGMGDNVLLGDRNGVRTPMQWNGGPNGGFSEADPGSLYLPPITDPVYGFGAVNVEAQQRNPSSLLNWTRRLIAMRKEHRAFGRGTLRFLRPGNRKILAYLREYEGETILCVANVSRAPQAVELDLSTFKERVPVELMGRSRFPPIGELPYLLTLGGYGCFAFRLAADVEAPAWHEERPMPPDLPVLVLVDSGWRTLFARAEEDTGVNRLMVRRTRDQLERQIIPRYFRAQPWFVHRGAEVEKFEFGVMREWTTEAGNWLLATVAVTLSGGGVQHYAIPLALAWEDDDEGRVGTLLHATLAKVRRLARVGVLFDAFWDDRFCCDVVAAMAQGETLAFGEGSLAFSVTAAYPGFAGPAGAATITRSISEHGRLRANLDDQLVLKSYRWLMEGTHPELEMSRFLTETATFPHIPQLAGVAEYADTQGRHSTLAILERYAPNQGDAWHTTLDFLERVLDECRTRHEPPGEGWHSAYASLMKTLGQRTAEFHRALARPDEAGTFGSEPVSPADLVDWVKKVRHEMELMFERLELALPALPEADWHSAGKLLAARPRLYRRIVRASGVRPGAMKTRCHGNYHLGQVWLVNNDFLIANYGGEPGRSWAERRRKHTPLQDVACMLLSLSQAGAAAMGHVAGDSAEVNSALQRHVDDWERVARRAFFRSYRKAMTGHPSYPADAATAEALMTLFLAEQAISQVSDALVQRATGVGSAMRRLLQVAQR
ncbi:MAG: maltose alpha-D-glucosyltransferase [Gammaproteobacteria bacterium]|nr:maltose alpha-D-glucosyltransferase [Gammaproteobacteria bacterium]MBU1409818.1 maltose alpha-D-glucosyltransferase [Gammaproteobacteria bacterium]